VLLAVATAGPTAALLRVGPDRDVAEAQERLERTATTPESATNAAYYKAFLDLAGDDRRALLTRVDIIDSVVPADKVQQQLERAVRKSVKPARRTALVDRLRGWWHKRAMAHLAAGCHRSARVLLLEKALGRRSGPGRQPASAFRSSQAGPRRCLTCRRSESRHFAS
jgi:hypothetical protein